jgi:hypothetical protein
VLPYGWHRSIRSSKLGVAKQSPFLGFSIFLAFIYHLSSWFLISLASSASDFIYNSFVLLNKLRIKSFTSLLRPYRTL